jgi:DnaK suppressor protein
MARREALIRLHKALAARRGELRRRLGQGLRDLGTVNPTGASGDAADAAFDTGSDEVVSQLAELEAKELRQIERAILKIQRGTYGLCEGCQCKIPVARLNALPYSTLCVKCQREMEADAHWGAAGRAGNWEQVAEGEGPDPSHVNLADLEMDLSK